MAPPRGGQTSLLRLAYCAAGINICYLYYGYLQERLFRPDKNGDRFDNTLFLFAVQCFVNALFALAATTVLGRDAHQKPLWKHAATAPVGVKNMPGYLWLGLIAATYLLAMLTSNEALRYVRYPAQALAKSCKMVPVMLGSALMGVRYSARQYATVMCITAGIFLFQMGGASSKHGSPKDSEHEMFGMALLCLSLVLDGFTGSNQHNFDREYQLSSHDLMLGMNAMSCAYLCVALPLTGELQRGLAFLAAHPAIQWDVLLFAMSSALGQHFIFETVTGPGSLACTTITTTRKFFTILISVFMYSDNRLDVQQWGGVALVFLGLGAELWVKLGERRHAHVAARAKKDE